MFKRLFGRGDKTDSGEHAGEPRGGLQAEEYRTADPRDIVEEDGVAMSGPGGAPQEGESVEERRERDRS
jgi:hypothetical protein